MESAQPHMHQTHTDTLLAFISALITLFTGYNDWARFDVENLVPVMHGISIVAGCFTIAFTGLGIHERLKKYFKK